MQARPRLRRSPFGYRRSDVDEALGARDAELAVLRQDIAALWLAFAEHDRILRQPGSEPAELAEPPVPTVQQQQPLDSEAASIGVQLAELDEVLASIETATRRLERAYAERGDEVRPQPEAQGEPRAGDD